jgi:hypothetical protein
MRTLRQYLLENVSLDTVLQDEEAQLQLRRQSSALEDQINIEDIQGNSVAADATRKKREQLESDIQRKRIEAKKRLETAKQDAIKKQKMATDAASKLANTTGNVKLNSPV